MTSDEASYVATKADPDKKKLGARLRNEMGKVANAVASTYSLYAIYARMYRWRFHATDLSHEQISEFRAKGVIVVEGVELTTEEVKVHLSIYIYLSLVLRIFFLSKRTI